MTTYVHKVKCINCQLHFVAYSWHEDWEPEFCPECSANAFLRWGPDEENRPIFELVPGSSPFEGMEKVT